MKHGSQLKTGYVYSRPEMREWVSEWVSHKVTKPKAELFTQQPVMHCLMIGCNRSRKLGITSSFYVCFRLCDAVVKLNHHKQESFTSFGEKTKNKTFLQKTRQINICHLKIPNLQFTSCFDVLWHDFRLFMP